MEDGLLASWVERLSSGPPHPRHSQLTARCVCTQGTLGSHLHSTVCTFNVLRAKAKATSFSREESIIESLKPYMYSCLRCTLFCLIIQFKEFYLCES